MKKLLLVFILLLTYNVHGQNIITIFESLPDEAMDLGLTQVQKKEVSKISKNNKNTIDALNVLAKSNFGYSYHADVKNGYLKLVGNMEGFIELCFWKTANGKQLIAVYHEACGPGCNVESLKFYDYDGKKFTPKPLTEILPFDLTQAFDAFLLTRQSLKFMDANDVTAGLTFELPRVGKNILMKWGGTESMEVYKKYAKGDRMILVWANGRFTKSRIYWSRK